MPLESLNAAQVSTWLRENGWAALADAVEFGERLKVATNVGPVQGAWVKILGESRFVRCRDCERPNLCAILKTPEMPCRQPKAQ